MDKRSEDVAVILDYIAESEFMIDCLGDDIEYYQEKLDNGGLKEDTISRYEARIAKKMEQLEYHTKVVEKLKKFLEHEARVK